MASRWDYKTAGKFALPSFLLVLLFTLKFQLFAVFLSLAVEFLFLTLAVAFRIEDAGGAGFEVGIVGKTLYPVGGEF